MSTPRPARRTLLLTALAALSLAAAPAALAATPTVAVLSLIGDEMTLVVRRLTTGSRLDRNEHRALPVAEPVLDVAAAVAAERAIREGMPAAQRLRVSVTDKRLFALQDAVLEAGPASDGMRQALQSLLLEAKATHLLLVTKRRDAAQFRLADTHIGDGKIAGVGIFVDSAAGLEDPETRKFGQGYFACYAYVKATLVEVASMRVLGTGSGEESTVTTAIGSNAATAWDVLSDAAKAEQLMRVTDLAVYRATREIAALAR